MLFQPLRCLLLVVVLIAGVTSGAGDAANDHCTDVTCTSLRAGATCIVPEVVVDNITESPEIEYLCSPGFHCDQQSRACAPVPNIDTFECDPESNDCLRVFGTSNGDPSLMCTEVAGGELRCRRAPRVGDACKAEATRYSVDNCARGIRPLRCTGGKCEAVARGSSCDDSVVCEAGSHCAYAETDGDERRCVASFAAGEACVANEQCRYGLLCAGQRCSVPYSGRNGDGCTASDHCSDGAFCDSLRGECNNDATQSVVGGEPLVPTGCLKVASAWSKCVQDKSCVLGEPCAACGVQRARLAVLCDSRAKADATECCGGNKYRQFISSEQQLDVDATADDATRRSIVPAAWLLLCAVAIAAAAP